MNVPRCSCAPPKGRGGKDRRTMLGQLSRCTSRSTSAELIDFAVQRRFRPTGFLSSSRSVARGMELIDYRPLDRFRPSRRSTTSIAGTRRPPDGQHRDLEAVDHPDAGACPDHATARGRRVAAQNRSLATDSRLDVALADPRWLAGHPLHRADGYLRHLWQWWVLNIGRHHSYPGDWSATGARTGGTPDT